MICALTLACSRSAPRTASKSAFTITPDSIDSLVARGQAIDSPFAYVGHRLVYVRDSSQWPDSADAEVHISRTRAGQPLRHLEAPISESGDWHLELIHYFDSAGRTQRFVSEGRYFRPDCGSGVMVDRTTISYRPDFSVADSEHSLRDSRGAVTDSAMCGHAYDFFAGRPRASFESLREAGLAR